MCVCVCVKGICNINPMNLKPPWRDPRGVYVSKTHTASSCAPRSHSQTWTLFPNTKHNFFESAKIKTLAQIFTFYFWCTSACGKHIMTPFLPAAPGNKGPLCGCAPALWSAQCGHTEPLDCWALQVRCISICSGWDQIQTPSGPVLPRACPTP